MNKEYIKPIQSQEEADEVFNSLVRMTVETLKVPTAIAKIRVSAMLKWSREMNINPLTKFGQMMIDNFMRQEQSGEKDFS